MKVTIVGGDNTDADGYPAPNSPLVIVDDHGIHVDMSTVPFGQLWDGGKTITRITWGNQAVDGRIFGTVLLKTGAMRTYFDPNLIDPYVKAWNLAKAAPSA
jgi:hypothetical protein